MSNENPEQPTYQEGDKAIVRDGCPYVPDDWHGKQVTLEYYGGRYMPQVSFPYYAALDGHGGGRSLINDEWLEPVKPKIDIMAITRMFG